MKRNTFNMVIYYQTCRFSATFRNSLTSSKWMVPLTSLPLGNRTQTAFSPGILLSSSNQRVLEFGAKNSQCTFTAFESVSKQRKVSHVTSLSAQRGTWETITSNFPKFSNFGQNSFKKRGEK